MFTSPASRHAKRPPKHATTAVMEAMESRRLLSANVLTFHNDIAGTGLNAAETQLNPSNVKVGTFGKLHTTTVDGQVYAQPLVETGVTIANGVNTAAGAAGVHDVVFVATENDSLYAIDASPAGGAVLWRRSFLSTANSGGNQNNALSATAINVVTSADVGSGDLSPSIGITGTPVIDAAHGVLYLAVKTKQTIGGGTYFVQRIHGIRVADGTDAAAPYLVGATTGGNTNNTQIYVYGSGDGHVTDPYNATGRQVVQFNALREGQRTALSLVNGKLYAAWASHGDNGPYHGWVAGWDVSNLTTSGFQLAGVLNTSPNNGLAGIWEGGGRLVFEPDGSAFYFTTGNGSGGAPSLGSNALPTNANYNEAVVKVVADGASTPTSQNPNGWGLKVSDFFIPYNVTALDAADSDFGSGGPILLPDSAGVSGHPHLLIVGGKDGRVYVLDRDNLGGFDPVNDHALNAVPNGSGHSTPPNLVSGTLSTPAYYNGRVYLVSGYSGRAYAYAIGPTGALSTASQTSISNFGFLPGSVAISANSSTNGIAWVMDRNSNTIHAYDASTLATELWNSAQAAGGADSVGAVIKFAVPTIANGQVYVGTSAALVVYGLTPAATTVPNAPALFATALSGSSINLTWTDSSTPPNTASAYLIEQSTDGLNFNQVTTAGAGQASLAIGGLSPLTNYYFRMRGLNGRGNSPYSNIANATTTATVALIDYSGGFAGAGASLIRNGGASVVGSALRLTDGGTFEARSAFYSTPVDTTRFTTQFTFRLTSPSADGFTFALQGNGPTALGHYGGGLGFGPESTAGAPGIPKSVAVKFDLYNNQGEGINSTGLYTNGAAPTNIGSINLSSTGIDLHSGHVFLVNMSYDGTTLGVTLKDTQTDAAASQTYTINIPAVAGANAYAGFTGGTGGLGAGQDILTWTYAPSASSSPNAPSGLGAAPASATSVNLNWTINGGNQTGHHLDRATDPDFTQNLITLSLPPSPASYTDTAAGLAPGGSFYYRLRAYNSAGDSGNSNPVTIFIPVAPPKPSNQAVTNVTTNQIDITWQDNAGHAADGYHIRRAVNHGSFTLVATLPPTSRTPPSTYGWSDTGLAPGTNYEYHIEAFNVSGNNDFAGVNATTLGTPPSNSPYPGPGPWAVGGLIQAENFDRGGEGVAYHDLTTTNTGGQYRSADRVDIERTGDSGGGYNLGWDQPGEWLKYTVNVASSGMYNLDIRNAYGGTNASGGTIHLECDEVDVTGAITLPKTGGWQTWRTTSLTGINLTAGQHVLRLVMDKDGAGSTSASAYLGNVNWFRLTLVPPPTASPFPGPNPAPVPGTVQAENFDNGGEGVAYHDLTGANVAGQYRTTNGVDIERTSDSGGGYDVGWNQPGEWLKYTVNVAGTGSYTLNIRTAYGGANASGGTVHLEVDGMGATGPITLPKTGGWQTWQTVSKAAVSLTAGQHVLRLVFDKDGALRKTDGSLVWDQKGQFHHGSVLATQAAGEPAVIAPTGRILRARDGTPLGDELRGGTGWDTPIVEPGVLYYFISRGDAAGGFFYAATLPAAAGGKLVTTAKVELPKGSLWDGWFNSSMLYHEGLVYAVNALGILRVYDLQAGKLVYQQQLDLHPAIQYVVAPGVSASPAIAGKYLYITDNHNTTVILEPGRIYKPVAKNTIHFDPGGGTVGWGRPLGQEQVISSPVFCGNDIYIVGGDYIYCVRGK